MLLYGGIGLFFGGLVILLGGNALIKDAEKAAKARKQAPILMIIGALALTCSFYLADAVPT